MKEKRGPGWSPQSTSATNLIPSMVCSEPLISEDAPPQWKCICSAMYTVPSVAVMRMVGGRLICTGREDEQGLRVCRWVWMGQVYWPGSSPAPLPTYGASQDDSGLELHQQGHPWGGGDWHTGQDERAGLGRCPYQGTCPPTQTWRAGAGPRSGKASLSALGKEDALKNMASGCGNQNATLHFWPIL